VIHIILAHTVFLSGIVLGFRFYLIGFLLFCTAALTILMQTTFGIDLLFAIPILWLGIYWEKTHLFPTLKRKSQKECKIEEGHLMSDHAHILISIPPKYSVSQVVGFIKGKSAISIARTYMGRRKNFTGQSFWARGYYVSTVGRDEETVRNYIKHPRLYDTYIPI
jgi:hypothetical protein